MDYCEPLPELLVGSFPAGPSHIRILADEGVRSVLCLQTDDDLFGFGRRWQDYERWYAAEGIQPHRVPIRDGDPIDLTAHLPEAVRLLDELIRTRPRVYLHCSAGVGRAPSVAAAYLHWVRGWPLDRAIEHLKSIRDCEPNRSSIEEATEAFAQEDELT